MHMYSHFNTSEISCIYKLIIKHGIILYWQYFILKSVSAYTYEILFICSSAAEVDRWARISISILQIKKLGFMQVKC